MASLFAVTGVVSAQETAVTTTADSAATVQTTTVAPTTGTAIVQGQAVKEIEMKVKALYQEMEAKIKALRA